MLEKSIKQKIYQFGGFQLNPAERILLRGEERVSMTPRAFDLLLNLVEANGHLLTKEALLEKVWDDAVVEEGNLNRTISALRKVLGEKKGEKRFIETVPKRGYRFVAEIEVLNESPAEEIIPKPPQPAKTYRTTPVANPQKDGKWISKLVFTVIFMVAALGIYFFFFKSDPKLSITRTEPEIRRLTNGPFAEDGPRWTNDNQVRFIRFTGHQKTESFIMNIDGTNQRRANTEIKNLRAGLWSHNGKKVLFAKENDDLRTTYLANADGSNEIKLPFTVGNMDWSPDDSKFVYQSSIVTDKTNNSEIFLYTLETGTSVNLTNSETFDADCSFSPDGTEIAFVSNRDGNQEVYVMNTDGTRVRRMTNNPAVDSFPVFSPDGTQLVFNSNRENENADIYLLNVNHPTEPVKLTTWPSNEEIHADCWSPDGTQIVFMSDRETADKSNIYTMTVEPFKPQLILADEKNNIRFPALSPDGKKIAYEARLEDGNAELRLFDLETKSTKTLLKTENTDIVSSWSPDGTQLAFNRKVAGDTDIYTIRTDGSDLKNLTGSRSRDLSAVWSPDGREIIFSSDRDGNFEKLRLFRMNADGTDQQRITRKDGYEMTPAWSPDGRTIAFAGDRNVGTLDISLLDINNPEDEKVLIVRRFHDTFPVFSPDGKRLAFVSQSDGNNEIYLINTDGTGLLRLTRNLAEDNTPQFTRDGRKLIFSSNRSGKFALYEVEIPE